MFGFLGKAGSTSVGSIAKKAGNKIKRSTSRTRIKRKAQVARGRLVSRAKDAFADNFNRSMMSADRQPQMSPSGGANNVTQQSSINPTTSIASQLSNVSNNINNTISNISNLQGSEILNAILRELAVIKELTQDTRRDVNGFEHHIGHLRQSSTTILNNIETFRDSFDSNKIHTDNKFDQISDDIDKLEKLLKQLSMLVEEGAMMGGGGSISDMFGGRGRGRGRAGRGGKATGKGAKGKAGGKASRALAHAGKFAKFVGAAGILFDPLKDGFDLLSGNKSIDEWAEGNKEWSWWNVLSPFHTGAYVGDKVGSGIDSIGSAVTGDKNWTLGGGIYDAVDKFKGLFGASDADKEKEAELRTLIDNYNKSIEKGRKVSTYVATKLASSGYTIDPGAVSTGKDDTKLDKEVKPIKYEGVKSPTPVSQLKTKVVDSANSVAKSAVATAQSVGTQIGGALSAATSATTESIGNIYNKASETASKVVGAVKASPAVREAVAIKELIAAGVKSPKALALIMGQLSHESGGFRHYKELGGAKYFAKYDGRRDLGNTQPGDGARFAGRGPIQITGRYNYTKFSKDMGVDVVSNPSYLETPEGGIKAAIWFLKTRNLFKVAEAGDINTLTRRINGRFNGLPDRIKKTEYYLKKFAGQSVDSLAEAAGSTVQESGHTNESDVTGASTTSTGTIATSEAQGIANAIQSGGGFSSDSTISGGAASLGKIMSSGGESPSRDNKSPLQPDPVSTPPTPSIPPVAIPATQSGTIKGTEKSVKIRPGVDMSGVNPTLKQNLFNMGEELFQLTGRRIQVNSGYRDSKKQAQLYATMPKGKAARPGRSMHEFGYAVDINTPEANYLAKSGLMDKYGFHRPLLRIGETWHLEPKAIAGKYDQIRKGYKPSLDVQQTMEKVASKESSQSTSEASKATNESEGLVPTPGNPSPPMETKSDVATSTSTLPDTGTSISAEVAKSDKLTSQGGQSTSDVSKTESNLPTTSPTTFSTVSVPPTPLPEIQGSRDSNIESNISSNVGASINSSISPIQDSVDRTNRSVQSIANSVNNTNNSVVVTSGGSGPVPQTSGFFAKDAMEKIAMENLSMYLFTTGVAIRG